MTHLPPSTGDAPELAAWHAFVESLRAAGDQLAADTSGLDDAERADGFRALLRAVSNQLGRSEVDRDRPELVAFNGWRQKFLMDNPDFRYWVADIRADRRYRITGNRGDASYVSITAYATGREGAHATARLDSDSISFDETGGFEIYVGGEAPDAGDWLDLPDGASALWVRHFHGNIRTDRQGWCVIEPVEAPPVPPPIDPSRFCGQLRRLASMTSALPQIFAAATAADHQRPNELRHWSEMTGGAVFTEPDIHYLRGSWQLDPGEALLIEGDLVACRYWNILGYSRYLNSLDHRHRPVSYTGVTADVTDGRYRFVLAAENPGIAADWIDTEGRPFGIVVMRFLQPERPPELPVLRRIRLTDLREHR
jgi:hypothetical protein